MELGKDIKCIIFDFDGTLFHLEIDWDKLKQELNISKKNSPRIGEHIQNLNLIKHTDLEIVTKAELRAIGENKLDVNIGETIRFFISKGIKLAILTRNSRYAVEKVLKNSGIDAGIYIVGREDIEKLKPDPEGLSQILEQFEVDPNQAILVGDTFHDVEAAKACGAISAIVKNPRLKYVPKGADFYIQSINDLIQII